MLKSVSDVIGLEDVNLLSILKENKAKWLLIMYVKSCRAYKMVTDYARKIMSRASGRNGIFPIFFQSLPTFPCFLSYFLGLPVPTFPLLFAGKPVEALQFL